MTDDDGLDCNDNSVTTRSPLPSIQQQGKERAGVSTTTAVIDGDVDIDIDGDLNVLWQKVQDKKKKKNAIVDSYHRDGDGDTQSNTATVITTEHLESVVIPTLKAHDFGEASGDSRAVLSKALGCLVHFVGEETKDHNKAVVVSTGALEQINCILRHTCTCREGQVKGAEREREEKMDSEVQQKIMSLAMQVLSDMASDANDVIKNDYLLPTVPMVLKVMHRYSYSDDEKLPKDLFAATAEIQRHGCKFLRHLSNPLLQELVAVGSPDTIVEAMRYFPNDCGVQEHGNATMYNLLPLMASSPSSPITIVDDSLASSASALLLSDLPEIVVRGMECHPDSLSVQQYGILVLKRLCQNDKENYEIILQCGLTAVLKNIEIPSPEEQCHKSPVEENERECLAQLAIQFLQDLSKISNHSSDMDMLRVIAAKGGMEAALQLINPSDTNPYRSLVNIQDPAMAVIRNLCIHPDNRWEAITAHSEIFRNIVPSVLSTMERFVDDAAIQAYGCDVLGRLSLSRAKIMTEDDTKNDDHDNEGQKYDIEEKKTDNCSDNNFSHFDMSDVVSKSYSALKGHRDHAGVQDRAVFVLVVLCSAEVEGDNAMETVFSQRADNETRDDVIEFVRASKVPTKGLDRLNTLVTMLERKIGVTSFTKNNGTGTKPAADLLGKENTQNFLLTGGWRTATNWMKKSSNLSIEPGDLPSNISPSSMTTSTNPPSRGLSWRSTIEAMTSSSNTKSSS